MSKEIKNVYVNENGEISLNKGVGLISLTDLESMLCACGESIDGFIQTSDGIYYWQSAEEMEEIIGNNVEIESGEYIKIDNHVPTIYNHFMEQIDEALYEVVTMKISSDNTVLYAVVLPKANNNFYHIHNMWLNEEDEIMENCSMLPRFFIDKYKIA